MRIEIFYIVSCHASLVTSRLAPPNSTRSVLQDTGYIVIRAGCLALIGCASVYSFQQATSSPDSDREQDVYALYSLMLTNPQTSHGAYTGERFLIADTTGPGYRKDPCVRPPKEREAEFGQVLADYEHRKATPRQLKPSLVIDKPYTLLTSDQVKEFQQARSRPRQRA